MVCSGKETGGSPDGWGPEQEAPMGQYVNPGNRAFAEIADADYVDQTGLISLINQSLRTKKKLTCVSRPRRFGKSWAAKMLTAYYDCSCDSHALFDHRIIARTRDYQKNLNQFHVICFDVTSFTQLALQKKLPRQDIPRLICQEIHKELSDIDPAWDPEDSLESSLLRCVEAPDGKPFIFIIDEWDALIREAKGDPETQQLYLAMLRGWFKNISFTPRVVAAAYMTGILPIKKDGTQSAVSDFREYTMLHPGPFAKYTGFTETQVRRICGKRKMDFNEVQAWYDGYRLSETLSIYNPYSVMNAAEERACRSFWGKTSAAEGLTDYIRMDFDGLQETVARLIAGAAVSVKTSGFQNDLERFRSRDDILTLLVHLGYLTWNEDQRTAHIPNREVLEEFSNFLSGDETGKSWAALISRSRKLLRDTLAGNGDAVAAALEAIRGEQYAPQFYNNEQALRAVIKYAYIAAFGQYMKVEELPSGKGLADVAFLPAAASAQYAILVELKWNQTAGGALEQIRKKQYTSILYPYAGRIVLVGINYDEKTGRHSCVIEKA